MSKQAAWHNWPAWRLLGWPLGSSLAAWTWLVRLTAQARVSGPTATYQGPAVYVSWHRHVPYGLILHGKKRRWQLMSHAPYMEPIMIWSKLLGMHTARGAPSQRMRESLDLLVQALRRGESVVLFVDGPAGPPRQSKTGCVEIAQRAGVPIIPVSYRTRSNLQLLWRWDKALFPVPFDQVDVAFGDTISVASDADPVRVVEQVNGALRGLEGRD